MSLAFANDDKSRAFCEEIVQYLISRHCLASYDAEGYVALQWAGQPFEGCQDDRYHRLAVEWADHIYKYHDYLFAPNKAIDPRSDSSQHEDS